MNTTSFSNTVLFKVSYALCETIQTDSRNMSNFNQIKNSEDGTVKYVNENLIGITPSTPSTK